jgi:selenocysteine-specific elongation factor
VRPLAHWTPVHVHLGAANVTGRVAILEGPTIAPGASALVQIALDRPIGALFGDGLILRDQSAQRTIGGGHVIDIFPPIRGRAKPQRLDFLKAMENRDTAAALSLLLGSAPRGVNVSDFARNRNLTREEASLLFTADSVRTVDTPSGKLGFSPEHWKHLKIAVVESLAVLHRRSPNVIPNEDRVFLDAGIRSAKELRSAVSGELIDEGVLVREPSGVRLRTHVAQLSPADAALWKKISPLLQENPLRPPPVIEIANALGMDAKKTESFLVRVSRLGHLARVADNRFFTAAGLLDHARFTEEIAAGNTGSAIGGAVTAAQLRDRTGIGRTLAIEVLEYFDRIKFTRRVGDQHHLLRSAREALGEKTPSL